MYFQQDSTPLYLAENSVQALQTGFHE